MLIGYWSSVLCSSDLSGPAPSHPASSEKFHPRTWSRKAAWRAASRSGAPTGRNGPILSPTSRAGQAGAPVGSAPRKQAASSGNPLASWRPDKQPSTPATRARSEERRAGKEGDSTCGYRVPPGNYKKKKQQQQIQLQS